jgi:hypothetical protein
VDCIDTTPLIEGVSPLRGQSGTAVAYRYASSPVFAVSGDDPERQAIDGTRSHFFHKEPS